MRLQGKVALITGGTRGIGRKTAIMMAREGASVVFTGRNPEPGREVEEQIRAFGGNGMFVAADNKDEAAIAAAVAKTVDTFGSLTVLMNNAIAGDDVGSGGDTHVDVLDTKVLDGIMRGALYGAIWASKYAIPHMRKAGVGSIINTSASSSVGAIPERPSYQASKGAINSLTRQMAYDYGKENIRVNSIIVGFIYNEGPGMTKILENPTLRKAFEDTLAVPQLGETSDIAYGAIYLASDESKYVTGSQLFIEGGALCHQAQPKLNLGELAKAEREKAEKEKAAG